MGIFNDLAFLTTTILSKQASSKRLKILQSLWLVGCLNDTAVALRGSLRRLLLIFRVILKPLLGSLLWWLITTIALLACYWQALHECDRVVIIVATIQRRCLIIHIRVSHFSGLSLFLLFSLLLLRSLLILDIRSRDSGSLLFQELLALGIARYRKEVMGVE